MMMPLVCNKVCDVTNRWVRLAGIVSRFVTTFAFAILCLYVVTCYVASKQRSKIDPVGGFRRKTFFVF